MYQLHKVRGKSARSPRCVFTKTQGCPGRVSDSEFWLRFRCDRTSILRLRAGGPSSPRSVSALASRVNRSAKAGFLPIPGGRIVRETTRCGAFYRARRTAPMTSRPMKPRLSSQGNSRATSSGMGATNEVRPPSPWLSRPVRCPRRCGARLSSVIPGKAPVARSATAAWRIRCKSVSYPQRSFQTFQ
jgi:hypothetical protein